MEEHALHHNGYKITQYKLVSYFCWYNIFGKLCWQIKRRKGDNIQNKAKLKLLEKTFYKHHLTSKFDFEYMFSLASLTQKSSSLSFSPCLYLLFVRRINKRIHSTLPFEWSYTQTLTCADNCPILYNALAQCKIHAYFVFDLYFVC